MSARRLAISGTARAASSLLTVTRTSWLPALASSATWSAVPDASAVSVFVIDCTTMGCAEPTGTPPTWTVGVFRRVMVDKRRLRVLDLRANSLAQAVQGNRVRLPFRLFRSSDGRYTRTGRRDASGADGRSRQEKTQQAAAHTACDSHDPRGRHCAMDLDCPRL